MKIEDGVSQCSALHCITSIFYPLSSILKRGAIVIKLFLPVVLMRKGICYNLIMLPLRGCSAGSTLHLAKGLWFHEQTLRSGHRSDEPPEIPTEIRADQPSVCDSARAADHPLSLRGEFKNCLRTKGNRRQRLFAPLATP